MNPEDDDSAGHQTAMRSCEFTVELPMPQAFALFEPLGEKNWAADWAPRFPTAADAALSDGTVFTVDRRGHDGRNVQTIWLMTRYLPEAGVVEYRCVVPGERVSWIAVLCRPANADTTTVEVSYRYTGLSAAGDAYIAGMTDEAFGEFIGHWDAAIREYLHRIKIASG